jgi:hypothetical protein
MNNCESCGSALMPGAFFCGECGSSTRSRPNMNDSRPTDTREVQLDQNVALAPRPGQPQEGFVPRFSEESLSRDQAEEPDSRDAGHQVWSDAPGDETVVRVAPAKEPLLSFTISFANGDVIVVSSGGLIGRNPSAGPGEAHEHLVIVTDPDRTVSKTHLEFGIDAGEFWVADRFSGNGTTIFETGKPPRRLVPGRKYQVGRGSRVGIGEQSFVVT